MSICKTCKYHEHKEWEDSMMGDSVMIHWDYCHFPLHDIAITHVNDMHECEHYERSDELMQQECTMLDKRKEHIPSALYNKETDEIVFIFPPGYCSSHNVIEVYGDIQHIPSGTSKITNASKYIDAKTLELLSVPNNLEIEVAINQFHKTPSTPFPPEDNITIKVIRPREQIFSKTTSVGKLKPSIQIKQ